MSLAHLVPALPVIVSTSLARGFGLGLLGQSAAFGFGCYTSLIISSKNKMKALVDKDNIFLGVSIATLIGAATIKSSKILSQTSFANVAGELIASKITNPLVLEALCNKFTQGAAIGIAGMAVMAGIAAALQAI